MTQGPCPNYTTLTDATSANLSNHSGDGPASLPVGPCVPICLPLMGKEVRHG